MLSTRRTSTLVSQSGLEAYRALFGFVIAKLRQSYQLLGQDDLRINTSTRSRSWRDCLRVGSWKFCARAFVSLCLFIAIIVLFRGVGTLNARSHTLGLSRATISKDQYITAILSNPLEGLVDPDPIRKKCDDTKFQPGLVWHCDTLVGGIGNVANMLLNCVRYAVEAGATTLILPRLGARSDDLLDLGGSERSVDLSSLFDVDYFVDSWKVACPQMRALISDLEISTLSPFDGTPEIYPSLVKQFRRKGYLIVDPTGWREAFDIWEAKDTRFNGMSADKPVRVRQHYAMAEWNREIHSLQFANSFPRLFRYPVHTRRLAALALRSLEMKISHPVVPEDLLFASETLPSSTANHLSPNRLSTNTFLGAHLRVAADAANAKWPGYESQAPFYINEAKRLNLTTIYLATGSPEHRDRFCTDATLEGLNVIVKEDLFDSEELAELRTLTWDQQALVDYDVLLRSSFFYGAVRSSFSWSLALRRGTLPEAMVLDTVGESTERYGEEIRQKDEYRDGLSAIIGRYGNINPEGMWP